MVFVMSKKKVNPRRIPLPRNAINKDAIIEEAMKDDIYFCFAWDRVKQHQDSHVCYNTFYKCINGM